MEKKSEQCEAFEWLESIGFALVFTLLILVFAVNFSRVSGHSMMPTLSDGDRVLVQTAFYTPKRGDIITTDALIDYEKPLAKRIIALEGDVVDIDISTGDVSVNGIVLDEPYLFAPTTQQMDVTFPLTVPSGKAFIMGDNRPGSRDSRFQDIGCIDARDILGR
ncbi:MAG: signal peptidase I, partial [Christensenella sp.]